MLGGEKWIVCGKSNPSLFAPPRGFERPHPPLELETSSNSTDSPRASVLCLVSCLRPISQFSTSLHHQHEEKDKNVEYQQIHVPSVVAIYSRNCWTEVCAPTCTHSNSP